MAPQRRRSQRATDEAEPAADRESAEDGDRAEDRKSAEDRNRAEDREAAEDRDWESAEDRNRAEDREAAEDRDWESAEDRQRADAGREDGRGRVRTAWEAAQTALDQVLEFTAKPPESIIGVQRTNDGWSICFELVEDRRIPSSADILATYEATIDTRGELMSFQRIRRYSRGRGDGNGGSR
jgi:hypothetical protein